jgi:hypothetical protein
MKLSQLPFFFFPSLKPKALSLTPVKIFSANHEETIKHNTFPPSDSDNIKLLSIWDDLVDTYFPFEQELKNYKVVWSGRVQTRCLASCNIQKKIVRVAPAMRLSESEPYLEPLLYHELCHAVVGIKIIRGRRKIHTPEFKDLERQHPQIALLDAWIRSGGWTKAVRKEKRTRFAPAHKSDRRRSA